MLYNLLYPPHIRREECCAPPVGWALYKSHSPEGRMLSPPVGRECRILIPSG
jgi:hypothetical protein